MARQYALLALWVGVEAADKGQPHYHQGVLPKFKPGPPAGIGFRLSGAQQSALAKGENVLATIANRGGDGSCVAVLDIPVPKHIIWERITDYKRARARERDRERARDRRPAAAWLSSGGAILRARPQATLRW